MIDYQKHFISPSETVKETLTRLNNLAPNAIGFIVDEKHRLIGSVTDGDIRRGLIADYKLNDKVIGLIQKNPFKLRKDEFNPQNFKKFTEKNIRIVPIVDDNNVIIDIINLEDYISLLPVDVVIMAGGKGTRLKPLTDNIPKPLLKVGDKPIIEHTIDRLMRYGVQDIHISINYLGQQLIDYFGDGSDKGVNIHYIHEDEFFGTAGALTLNTKEYNHKHIMFMNSDLLTNIDYASLYNLLISNEGDMAVSSVPYEVKVPYGVIEAENGQIKGLKEKPTYTFYSNAGIYIIKTKCLDRIPKNKFFNATDLIEDLINSKMNVLNFPIHSYWLDIGKHQDFEKAQEDIKHIKL